MNPHEEELEKLVLAHETEQIRLGPASRTLDALVAEKILGWTEVHFDDKPDSEGDHHRPSMDWMGIRPGEDFYRSVPECSTDIAAAWEVVEKLYAVGYDVSLVASHEGHCRYMCRVSVPLSGKVVHIEYTDTAPLAICRAPLKEKA